MSSKLDVIRAEKRRREIVRETVLADFEITRDFGHIVGRREVAEAYVRRLNIPLSSSVYSDLYPVMWALGACPVHTHGRTGWKGVRNRRDTTEETAAKTAKYRRWNA